MTIQCPPAFRLSYVAIVHASSCLAIFLLFSTLYCPLLFSFVSVLLSYYYLHKGMNHSEITERYCPLLKQMQLTSRACKSPLTLATAIKKVSLYGVLFFKFIASLQSKLCEGLTAQNTTENDCIT